MLALVQLLDHEGFKYAALERREPRTTDEQIANRARQKLGREPSDAKLKQ